MRLMLALAFAFALMLTPGVPPQAQQQQTPTFTTRAEVVLVDFVVADKSDRPVRGLTEKDFVVKEDGKERPIVSFTAFDGRTAHAPTAATAPAATAAAESQTPPSAAPVAAPATVLLIDDGHLSPRQAAAVRPALKALLTTAAQTGGILSLVAPISKVSVASKLSDANATAAFEEGIARITGQRFDDASTFPISDPEAIAAERGDAQTLGRLTSRFQALNPTLTTEAAAMLVHNRAVEIAHDARQRRRVLYGVMMLSLNWLSTQAGRHSLVIVSPGFARDPDDREYNAIVTRSMRVNAPVHFVDIRGLQGVGLQSVAYAHAVDANADKAPFDWNDSAEGPTTLANDTGGLTIGNTNDLERGLGRVIESIATYYVLGYEAPAHARPGFKKITVDAKPKGLKIRARRGYFVEPPAPAPAPPTSR
jgi:VWFA-related protein